ncbi:MAG: FAD-binding oxidoreductase [Nostoc sp.]|uniref:FAD-binding oxidoreductase n=1 Tax=Nostoc sp. TaxID=1180 RepID=UPI002FF619BF
MEGNLKQALSAWQNILGLEHVITDEASLKTTHTATFLTTQRSLAIIRPSDRAQVQECLKIANQYQIPIYPISTGKNWGYGSSVPVQDSCVIMSLARLNRIVDYNEKLAYVTVEPGVTQRQLFEYLQSQKSNLWMSVTGSTPDSSLIGNILERGLGEGLYGDRFNYVCGLEVVLPTGECIHTGFGRFADARAVRVNRWGVGPYVDGLFTQSNLGVVTQMTLWLTPIPKYFQLFWYAIDEDTRLEDLVDAVRYLKLQGLIPSAFVINNDIRMLSYQQQYPWQEAGGEKPLPLDLRHQLRKQWGGGLWGGEVALYSANQEHGEVVWKLIKETLGKVVNRLYFLDDAIAQMPKTTLTEMFPNIDTDEMLKCYNENPKRGFPTELALSMTYWRKYSPRPSSDINPDRDGCGLIWCSPAVPFEGQEVRKAVKIIEETTNAYFFEPNIGLNCITERNINITAAIVYDRQVNGEDERALACYEKMRSRLIQAGYFPYRLSTHSMQALPPAQDDYNQFLNKLKQVLDPNNILAPGRYEFYQPDNVPPL